MLAQQSGDITTGLSHLPTEYRANELTGREHRYRSRRVEGNTGTGVEKERLRVKRVKRVKRYIKKKRRRIRENK